MKKTLLAAIIAGYALALASAAQDTGYEKFKETVILHFKDGVPQEWGEVVPGSIIIAHMNHPEKETAEGVIAAIPELKKRGFKFVKLSDYKLKDAGTPVKNKKASSKSCKLANHCVYLYVDDNRLE